MKIIKCYDIHVWDGGDRSYHKYYLARTDDDTELKKWKAQHKHDTAYDAELIIFDSFDEIDQYENGELRRRALAKLTDAEKIALGLKS